MHTRAWFSALGASSIALLLLVILGISHYEWNVSTFLHMDTTFGENYSVPPGIVLYEDGGYDGMAYYEIAREIPALFTGGGTHFGSAYRFQRIILPLFGYVLALGSDQWFPFSFLVLNLAATLGSLVLMLLMTKRVSVHALTIVFNPAMLVGILFSLTEPLSLFFMVLFFFLFEKQNRQMNVWSALALLLSLLSRETTIFLIVLLFVWNIGHRQYKNTLWLLLPVALFLGWQYFLALHFDTVAFQASSHIINLTLRGPRQLVFWLFEHVNNYRLSSLPLLLFLVLLSIALIRDWWSVRKTRTPEFFCFLLTGLTGTMLSMDPHMWGVITSIGRVVTPMYPVYALYAVSNDSKFIRMLSAMLIVLSVVSAIGIALVHHPYRIS